MQIYLQIIGRCGDLKKKIIFLILTVSMWEEGYVCKRTGAIGGQKRLPEPPLDSEILAVVVSHMGAGNQTQFICKRSVSPALSFFFFYLNLYCWY